MVVEVRRGDRFVEKAALLLLGTLSTSIVSSPASAQSAVCGDIQPMLVQRKTIADSLNTGKKQIDAKFACTRFGALVSNGTTLIKWVDANKDWCQIPDTFAAGIKQDHAKAVSIRAKACDIAAKQAKGQQQQAKQGGGGGLLGGGGLSGDMRMPQGAL